jgi:hypothetical protein
MRHDPDSRLYYFSEEQLLPPDGRDTVRRHLYGQKLQSFRDAFRPDPEQGGGGTAKLIIGSVIVIACFASVIIAAMTGHPAIAVALFGGMIALMGLLMIFGRVAEAETVVQGIPGSQRVTGFLIMLIGLSVCVPMLLVDRLGSAAAFILLGGLLFTSGGLFLIRAAVSTFTDGHGKGEEVEGECIGYARYLSENRSRGHRSTVETAPVFRYYYNGEMLEALAYGRFGDPDEVLGESYPIIVSDRDKYHIRRAGQKNSSTASALVMGFLALCCLAAGAFLLYMAAHTDPTETLTVKNGSGKRLLYDQAIVNDTGIPADQWQIVLRTVAGNSYSEEQGGWLITYTDDTVNLAAEERIAEQYPVGSSFYFIIETETGKVLKVYAEENTEYKGSQPVDDRRQD